MSHYELDAKRLLCPMPVIKTQNAVKHYAAGDSLTILCTDPGAKQDIPTWCKMYGHQVQDIVQHDDHIAITIMI